MKNTEQNTNASAATTAQITSRHIMKGAIVYKNGEKGRIERRQGANHVTVTTHRVRTFQDFLTLKLTESICEVRETWKISDLSLNA